MSLSEKFWIVCFLVMVAVLIVGNLIDRRRQRSIEEFERGRRERKAAVERAARKSL